MIEIKTQWHLCEEEPPREDGYYLAITKGTNWITELEYIAGEDGGWNCVKYSDGWVDHRNELPVYAWSDCNEDIYMRMKSKEEKKHD